jgi:hypothetical protein
MLFLDYRLVVGNVLPCLVNLKHSPAQRLNLRHIAIQPRSQHLNEAMPDNKGLMSMVIQLIAVERNVAPIDSVRVII